MPYLDLQIQTKISGLQVFVLEKSVTIELYLHTKVSRVSTS